MAINYSQASPRTDEILVFDHLFDWKTEGTGAGCWILDIRFWMLDMNRNQLL
ncbi:MAG: hypothetical protein GWP06_14285 [Actinobacteria bacterium]|nr:hypothetical protein [Actinomycetota bacterium]